MISVQVGQISVRRIASSLCEVYSETSHPQRHDGPARQGDQRVVDFPLPSESRNRCLTRAQHLATIGPDRHQTKGNDAESIDRSIDPTFSRARAIALSPPFFFLVSVLVLTLS